MAFQNLYPGSQIFLLINIAFPLPCHLAEMFRLLYTSYCFCAVRISHPLLGKEFLGELRAGTLDSGDTDGSHGESYDYSIISKKLTEFVYHICKKSINANKE